jgi:hypothetical protein
MSDDPSGHYAALDVPPRADAAAIAAAFRRKARVLHPDIPGSGDADAFIRVKAAYDVLGDTRRRAAYDRAARAAVAVPPEAPDLAEPVLRWPRLSDLPIAVWAVLGGVLCLALVMTLVQLNRPPPPLPRVAIRPVAPPGPAVATSSKPATLPAAGPSTHYVLPGIDAIVWRRDAARNAYVPAGHVAAFSPVQALSMVAQHGLVEVRLADGSSGFVDAARLTAGDRDQARRAYCAYDAGPPPHNGEVLARSAKGAAHIALTNRGTQAAVVKLRDASGHAIAAVFLAPGGGTVLRELPDIAYRAEFAVGELWSRACNGFAAGMRAQRLPFYASPAGMSPLAIPPDLPGAPAPDDIPDAAFEGG